MHTPEQLRALAAALKAQRQADEDGSFVAVSRQACDEAAAILRAQADALASPPPAEPAAAAQGTMREQFEAWAESTKGLCLTTEGEAARITGATTSQPNEYVVKVTNWAWLSWQASRAGSAGEPAAPADWRLTAAKFLRDRIAEKDAAGIGQANRVNELESAASLLEQIASASPRGLDCALSAAAPAVPAEWVKAVQEAYGWLWHINNEPLAHIPMLPEGKAAYQARKPLRDLLTTAQRGEAINAVGATLENMGGAHPPAALRQQPEAEPPAEPGELPPLPDPMGFVDRDGEFHGQVPVDGVFSSEHLRDYARLALAVSPLPPERVERVMAAATEVGRQAGLSSMGVGSRHTKKALATIRAILEGRA